MSLLNQFIPLIISRMDKSEAPELKEKINEFLRQLDRDLDDNGFTPGTEILSAANAIDQVLINMDAPLDLDTIKGNKDDEDDDSMDRADKKFGGLDEDDEDEESGGKYSLQNEDDDK